MEDLIALLIPLLAVVGWLFGLFKGEESDQKENTGQQRNQRPTQGPAQTNQYPQSTEQNIPTPKGGTKEYYETKREQVDQLKNETKKAPSAISGSEISMGRTPKNAERRVQENTGEKTKEPVISVKKNITRKGLAESVIMAEILGSPRSVKPYRSVISERKR